MGLPSLSSGPSRRRRLRATSSRPVNKKLLVPVVLQIDLRTAEAPIQQGEISGVETSNHGPQELSLGSTIVIDDRADRLRGIHIDGGYHEAIWIMSFGFVGSGFSWTEVSQ